MNINDKIADLERQIAELKAEAAKPVVEYRAAEWPRDWGREDAEVSDTEGMFSTEFRRTIVGFVPDRKTWIDGEDTYEWRYCRVPIRDTYRTPSLPADAGKVCEFSDDGEKWVLKVLTGYVAIGFCAQGSGCFTHCRIKD